MSANADGVGAPASAPRAKGSLRPLPRRDPPVIAGKHPPHDHHVERAVLADSILHPHVVEDLGLAPEDFFGDAHQRIWAAILSLRRAAQPIDTVEVGAWLRDRGELARVGGTPYLAEIVGDTPAVSNVASLAKRLLELRRRRRLISEAQRIQAEGYGPVSETWLEESVAALTAAAAPAEARAPEPAKHFDVRGVLRAWITDGPLVHESMAIESLDTATGGGPVYGSRWYLLGAPDAGKTALLVQTADRYLSRGIVVGLLAVDEDPDDVFTRFWQRRGFTRDECERRSEESIRRMLDRATELDRLRVYDSTWTIERAADDLRAFATSLGQERAFLGVDSIQTVRCDAEAGESSLREQVTARAGAIRAMATKHRMILMATSEMSRGSYRSIDAAEATDDLASAKESGAIEYSARVMLALRSVKNESDLLEMRVAKNKHGPRGDRIGLKLDRRLQELTEADAPPVEPARVTREEMAAERGHRDNLAAAAALVSVLLETPGISTRDVPGALRLRIGRCGTDRAQVAILKLAASVVKVAAPRCGQRLFLDGSRLPDDVVAELEPTTRAAASSSKPPSTEAP